MTAPAVERAVPDEAADPDAEARLRAMLTRPDPGPVADRLVLLGFHGRRTGRLYDLAVGLHRRDDDTYVLATGAQWRHNFREPRPAVLTWRGRERPATLCLVSSSRETARGYLELLCRYGVADARRRLGITVNVQRTPTLDEMRVAVDRHGLSLVRVEFEKESR